MRNGDEWMDVPSSSQGRHGLYKRVVDVAVEAVGHKLARFLPLSRGWEGGAGRRRSSRQDAVAVRGAEPSAVSAVVWLLPYHGEFQPVLVYITADVTQFSKVQISMNVKIRVELRCTPSVDGWRQKYWMSHFRFFFPEIFWHIDLSQLSPLAIYSPTLTLNMLRLESRRWEDRIEIGNWERWRRRRRQSD